MELKSFATLDKTGKVVPLAKTYVYKHGTNTLADVFNSAGVKVDNPLQSNSIGYLQIAVANGAYDVQFEANGELGKLYTMYFSDVAQIEADVVELSGQVETLAEQTGALSTKVDDLGASNKALSDKVDSFGQVDSRVTSAEEDIAANAAAIASARTDIPAAIRGELADQKGYSKIGRVVQFSDLRTLQPDYDGQVVMLSSYNAGKKKGGGLFIGQSGTQKDDGGFIAAGNGFYWHRADLDLSKLTVEDFGAYGDGVTDDQPAVKRMYEFTLTSFASALTNGKGGSVSIRFRPGTYFVKPGVYTNYGAKVPDGAADAGQNPSGYYAAAEFKLEGPSTLSGRQIQTKIISDKSSDYVFMLNHRRLTVHGIIFDGQQTVKIDTTTRMPVGATSYDDYPTILSNMQGFLKNQCPAGQYVTISCVQINNTGGFGFFLQDTLDTTISQVFSSKTASPVIASSWSDPLNLFYGKWDHSTAIKMFDCNFSTFMCPAVWIPRCGQSIMENCWFEHGLVAFDINNGQWTLRTICIEDCLKDAVAWNSKYIMDIESVPTGNKVDGDSGPTSPNWASYKKNPDGSDITAWINGFEVGYAVQQTYGTYLNHPLRYKWLSGHLRGTNNTNANLWVNIGSVSIPQVGGIWEFEIIASGYLSVSSTNMPTTGDRSPGKTIIMVQRGSGAAPKVTWYNVGHGAVTSVKYLSQYNDSVGQIWFRLGAYTGEYSVTAKSTGVTRREAGQPTLFTVANTQQAAAPTGVLDAIPRYSVSTGRAGIGVQDDTVAIDTAVLNAADVYTDAFVQYDRVLVNNVIRAVPVYAMRPNITTQPAAQTVATGGTLTLTVAADYLRSGNGVTPAQWYKDGTAISGATGLTYTKANVTSADAGSYKVTVFGEPAANTKDSNAVTVTIT